MKNKEITIDGTVYVPKDSVLNSDAEKLDGLEYKIVRTYSAGVFAGYIESQEGAEVILRQARRLWYWSGASSLSQLAEEGVKNPKDCKFPREVTRVKLLNAIEILNVSEKAKESIDSVKVWEV